MEFARSPEQAQLQDSVAAMLNARCDLETLRDIATHKNDSRAALASEIDALGLSMALVPESLGGLGLGVFEAALIQETLGAACAPGHMEQAVAVACLAAADQPEVASILTGVADSSVKLTTALTERVSKRDGAGIVFAGDTLTGTASFVPGVDQASHLLVFDAAGGTGIVNLAAATQTEQPAIDRTRRFYRVTFTDAPYQRVSSTGIGDRALAIAGVLVAADTLGAAQHMLDKAVAYSADREQFGRAIGSFQAVKHMCAEMAARLEPARALVWHAAHALDVGDPEGPVMAALAKSHLSDVGTFVARISTEVHGGMGFTDLLGLHYWFKRIGLNRQLWGSPEAHRAHAAGLQGWA